MTICEYKCNGNRLFPSCFFFHLALYFDTLHLLDRRYMSVLHIDDIPSIISSLDTYSKFQ